MKKVNKNFIMSLRLPEDYGKAMNLIFKNEGVNKTQQIRFGLKLYMEKYKDILIMKDIDLWT